MTCPEIDKAYRHFIEVELNHPRPSQIEYIGINFCELESTPPVFKCYYSTKESLESKAELLQPFAERNMIHAVNMIYDTQHCNRTRYEIGLANRDNDNMAWLNHWVGNAFDLSTRQKKELDILANLPCCSIDNYRYAALYYLGFIAKTKTPFPLEAIKMHYILRSCEDPNKIGKNYYVDSEAVLRFFGNSGIMAFETLAAVLRTIVSKENELWMAAVDYFAMPGAGAKYKIYLKDRGGVFLSSLEELVTSLGLFHLSEQLNAFSAWLSMQDSLKLYGGAVCLTDRGEWSVNCYM